jgi:hypothetical protein
MKKYFLASVVLLWLCAGAALAQDVRYNFDRSTDFSKFKTYKWVNIKDAKRLDPLLDKQFKDAVDEQLATKGLTKVEGDSPADLLIGYQAAVRQEQEFTSYNTGWGYGPGWGGWYGGGTSTTMGSTSTINIGQAALDMYDSAGHDLVWRGVVSKTLDEKAKPEKQQKNLNKAVAKLLKNYPPPQKK